MLKEPQLIYALWWIASLLLFLPQVAVGAAVKIGKETGRVVIGNGEISLAVDERAVLTPALVQDGGKVSIAVAGEAGRPFCSIEFYDVRFDNFRLDLDAVREDTVKDALGRGVRFRLNGSAVKLIPYLKKKVEVGVELSLTFYDSFPRAVFSSATFTNRSDNKLHVDEIQSGLLCLDRRLVSENSPAWDLAYYQGGVVNWSEDYALVRLTRDFSRRNFLGARQREDGRIVGGGTPLVDLWSPETGVALACAEPRPCWIALPVRTTEEEGRVELCLAENPEGRLGLQDTLALGESCTTVRSVLILHTGDFYDPIKTYTDILRAQGVAIPLSSSPQALEPYWKSWGYEDDFTLDTIYKVLPQLKEAGIGWANLDAGWFDNMGDWNPVNQPGKFPGGEPDMRRFVARLHDQGFKSSIWWYPLGVHPDSRLAAANPDLLVQNEDGTFPLSINGNYYLCPDYEGAVERAVSLVRRFMQDWGFDGLYIDLQGLSVAPPCFNPAHHHAGPLDSYRNQRRFFEAIYRTAQSLKPGCPVEMCICAMPHDPFKMPFYNVASASDPVNLQQMRRRIKLEKAFRGPGFAVGDAYQVPEDEWPGYSVPESFESAIGTGAQVTTFFRDLSPEQLEKWKHWVAEYHRLDLPHGEYLNLYDLAWDRPEGHLIRKGERLYYAFYADYWSRRVRIELRGLEKGKVYRVKDYSRNVDLGTVSGDQPYLSRAFKDYLLLEVVAE